MSDEVDPIETLHSKTNSTSASASTWAHSWGTHSAVAHGVSTDDVKRFVSEIQQSDSEALLKKALFRLAKLLADSEIAEKFKEFGGVHPLVAALSKTKGNSLSYAVAALRAFSGHEVETLCSSDCVENIFAILSAKDFALNVPVVKSSLLILVEIASRAPQGFAIITGYNAAPTNSSSSSASLSTVYSIITACLAEKLPLDVKLSSLKLIIALLSTARDDVNYTRFLNGLRSTTHFKESLEALRKDDVQIIREELAVFDTLTVNGFTQGDLSGILRKEVNFLKTQLTNVTQLATEYRSEKVRLESELREFRRREPLVQLVWAEIIQLRMALTQAINAGFTYDLGNPASRYVQIEGLAPIDRLDVLAFMSGGTGVSSLGSGSGMQFGANLGIIGGGGSASGGGFNPLTDGRAAGSLAAGALPAQTAAMFSPATPEPMDDGVIPPPPPDASPSPGLEDMPGAPDAPTAPGAPGGAPSAPGLPTLKSLQPNRPAIKPKEKMKPLHWNRLLLGQVSEKMNHMWLAVEKAEQALKVDEEKLVELFCDLAKAKKKRRIAEKKENSDEEGEAGVDSKTSKEKAKSAEKSAKKESVRVLSDKRFNALAILLPTLPETEKVLVGIRTLDNSILSVEQIHRIKTALPSEEEVKQLADCGASDEELAKPERFVRQLAAIPQIGARVEVWLFMLKFEEFCEDTVAPLRIVDAGVKAVRGSKQLPRFLAQVLSVGNYLNGSTPRGQADGFDLNILSRLSMIKDNETGEVSLLQYLAMNSEQKYGERFGEELAAELTAIRPAAEFNLRACLNTATRNQGQIKTNKNLASLVIAGSDNPADRFNSVVNKFNAEAERWMADCRTICTQVNEDYIQLLLYLNPTLDTGGLARIQSDDLFILLRDFVHTVKEVFDKRQRDRQLEEERKKHQEYNAIMKEKLKAAKAEKAAAAAATSTTSANTTTPAPVRAASPTPQPQE